MFRPQCVAGLVVAWTRKDDETIAPVIPIFGNFQSKPLQIETP